MGVSDCRILSLVEEWCRQRIKRQRVKGAERQPNFLRCPFATLQASHFRSDIVARFALALA
jgi:hypothetical protein